MKWDSRAKMLKITLKTDGTWSGLPHYDMPYCTRCGDPTHVLSCGGWSCSCAAPPPPATDQWETAENGPSGCVSQLSHLAITKTSAHWTTFNVRR